ncbi:CLUMA_CG016637, isoform A [Clunio marinus]|uniref:CLUMA_CG016637, isoform A n=1 Tax=Clunio marinus TaxID=568069 RepID=A0A1J1IUA3_9DIPT|nr:CLUMA_CG016637, isoform A [Clunio marinus]
MNKKRNNFKSLKNVKKKKPLDLSQCMPPDLHHRVAKIISLPFGKDEPFEEQKKVTFKDLLMELDPNLAKKLDDGLTEENFVEIIEKHEKHKEIEVNIEPRAPERKLFKPNVNWFAEYINKTKKERIVWQTKLFKDNREIHEKSLFEQTEELIDIAAEHFAVWLKQMDEESNINKEFVKQLFSIGVESDASKALHVEPKEILAIPHEVAKVMNLPDHSIQNNVVKMSRSDKKSRMKKPNTVAFGRLLPLSLRIQKFNENLFDELYTINCPPELQSLEVVFHSILHLRSTHALIELLKAKPELPRAKYLEDNKLFDPKTILKSQNKISPLWTHF